MGEVEGVDCRRRWVAIGKGAAESGEELEEGACWERAGG